MITRDHDEFARKRSERDHRRESIRWLGGVTVTEQETALERARETWALSRPDVDRDRGPRGDPTHDD